MYNVQPPRKVHCSSPDGLMRCHVARHLHLGSCGQKRPSRSIHTGKHPLCCMRDLLTGLGRPLHKLKSSAKRSRELSGEAAGTPAVPATGATPPSSHKTSRTTTCCHLPPAHALIQRAAAGSRPKPLTPLPSNIRGPTSQSADHPAPANSMTWKGGQSNLDRRAAPQPAFLLHKNVTAAWAPARRRRRGPPLAPFPQRGEGKRAAPAAGGRPGCKSTNDA